MDSAKLIEGFPVEKGNDGTYSRERNARTNRTGIRSRVQWGIIAQLAEKNRELQHRTERYHILKRIPYTPDALHRKAFLSEGYKKAVSAIIDDYRHCTRSEGDSNPRTGFADYTLSRRASSTTRASLQSGFLKIECKYTNFIFICVSLCRFLWKILTQAFAAHRYSFDINDLSLLKKFSDTLRQRSSSPSGMFMTNFFSCSSAETTQSSIAGINNSPPFSRSTTKSTLAVDISTSTICPKKPFSVS